MMKWFSVVSILLVSFFLQAQEHKIDSINAIKPQNANISSDSLIQLYQKNLKDAEKLEYSEGVADAYFNLSTVYSYKTDKEKRFDYMLKAIRLYEKNKLWQKASHAYAEYGYSLKRNDLEQAQKYMLKGMKMAKKNGLNSVLESTYNNYGVIKRMQGQLDSALYYHKSSLELVNENDDKTGLPYALSNLAGIYGDQGEFDKAKENFLKALAYRKSIQDEKGIAENYVQLGEVYLAEKKLDSAINYFKICYPLAKATKYIQLEQYAYGQLIESYKLKNNADSALAYSEKFNALRDSIDNVDINKRIADLSIEYETEKKENKILEQRAQLAEKELEVKRKNQLMYGGLAFALALGLLGYLLYNQQKLKNRQLKKEAQLKTALAKIETQNKLQEQRLRISRDLHDNIGAQLTFIISSLDNLKYGFPDMKQKLEDKLEGISLFTTQTIRELRDTIWAMNKENVSFEDLQARITNFIKKAKNAATDVKFSFIIQHGIDPEHTFTSVQGMNIYRIIQESVNNSLKYANASAVNVKIKKHHPGFLIEIEDNGQGYNPDEVELGNGLNNMKKRASEIDGELKITSEEGKGTQILLFV